MTNLNLKLYSGVEIVDGLASGIRVPALGDTRNLDTNPAQKFFRNSRPNLGGAIPIPETTAPLAIPEESASWLSGTSANLREGTIVILDGFVGSIVISDTFVPCPLDEVVFPEELVSQPWATD